MLLFKLTFLREFLTLGLQIVQHIFKLFLIAFLRNEKYNLYLDPFFCFSEIFSNF